jgi:RsiW-degrading membrane proteinase PrsW (M82 family)
MSFPGAGAANAEGWTFNPPPGWPAPPPGWQPPQGWSPDPAWPPAPDGWRLWLPAGTPAAGPPAQAAAAGPGGGGIVISVGGQSSVLRPGQQARIGRAPENDIVVSDPTVSRLHAMVSLGASGWQYAQAGSAPSFSAGQQVTQLAIGRPVDITLGSLDGPVLRLEPADHTVAAAPAGAAPQPAGAAPQGYGPAPVTSADPGWRRTGPPPAAAHAALGDRGAGWAGTGAPWAGPGAPGPGSAGWAPGQQGYPQHGNYQQGHPQQGWGAPAGPGSGDELAGMLRVLFPFHSWLGNAGWRQGLRVGVIVYALLPLIFLAVLSSSTSLSTPGWAYSLYVAPLWLGGFWLLIRPPEHITKRELAIAGAIVVFTLIWINVVTISVNSALPVKNGIGPLSAIVIGVNEEVTKALPVLLSGIILLRWRKQKLDVRMWMLLGTVAGLTFGVVEQAFYTSNAIILVNATRSPSEAVTAILEFAERVFVDGFQHAVYAGISGFFMGLAVNYRRRRVRLIAIGIGTPALLHALNDWLGGTSIWLAVIVQAAALLLFLSYTMTAKSIEVKVRETPAFRGESMLMEAFTPPGQPPRA